MKRELSMQWKKLQAELDLAQQVFNTSHARLAQSLRASEAGKKPAHPLRVSLQQHLLAANYLLAMGRAVINFRKREQAEAVPAKKRGRAPMLSHA